MEKAKLSWSVWEEAHCSDYLDPDFYVVTKAAVSCCCMDFIDVT